MAISQNFPNSRPSLNLNFARSKKLDPRITFTRSSTATYVDEDGLVKSVAADTPRFEHNPSTGESLGLLIEESRTNLLVRSEEFNTTWTTGGSTIGINSITSPNGTVTADKIQEDSTTDQHLIVQSIGPVSIGAVYTLSCWVKSAERTQVSLTAHGEGYSAFDLSSGTIIQTGGNSNVTITPYPNGWYRCSTTVTKTNTNGAFYIINWNGTNTYTGTTGFGVYAWGAQVEAGNFPTSYIPTTSATVTRSADSAVMTGTNFTSWYNPNEWTLVTNTSVPSSNLIASPSDSQSISINDGTINNYYGIRYVTDLSGPYIDGYANASGSPTIDFAGSNGSSFPNPVKSALAVKTNDSAFSYNGNTTEVDTVVTLSTAVNRLVLTSVNLKAGTIAQVLYYPSRLPNSTLQQLTK